MLRYNALSFLISPRECGQKFSHFLSATGELVIVDVGVEFAKVCVMAEDVAEVTPQQRSAILEISHCCTTINPMLTISFGRGLSPFETADMHRMATV